MECVTVSHCAFRRWLYWRKKPDSPSSCLCLCSFFAQWTNTKTCCESLKIGHKIHLAHILMPNRLCFISSGVFSFLLVKGDQGSKLSQLDWKLVKVIPSSETCKPGLLLAGLLWAPLFCRCCKYRYLHDQRNLVSTALWGTKEAPIWA